MSTQNEQRGQCGRSMLIRAKANGKLVFKESSWLHLICKTG